MPVARKRNPIRRNAKDPREQQHWPGCEETHFECALARLEQARAEWEWHADVLAEASAAISLARATIEMLPNRSLAQDEALQGLIDFEDRLDAHGPEVDHPEMEDETRGR